MKKDLITVKELTTKDIKEIFELTDRLKKNKSGFSRALSGKTLALVFQKPSNRTRVSFEVGMYQLGGYTLYMAPNEINLGVRESIKDAAKTLSRYVDAIVLRTFEHKNILEMARYSDKPVINGLSDFAHPCQALADVYTVREKLKGLKGKTLVFVGDGNNVCNSLLYACARAGLNMKVAAPSGYEPQDSIFREAKRWGKATHATLELFHDPKKAVRDADVIYTDVWASMGQEKEAASRKKVFGSFQVNKDLLRLAKPHVLIMHCLPAHRGQEITDEVLDGKNSVVFDQAENRMHVQKAILIMLLK
ncbi:MAG: ornithine carbamoyltransferase [Omnitrophica WOR_2 bacterium SM23_72]|nr:MAG: ornithine carbamoyltransferase [Omnitrophica WOR_2 bacterium SM23_72]